MPTECALLGVIKDSIVILAALAGAGAAWFGIGTWWRQLRGTNKYQVGQKTLRALFSAHQSVRSARDRLFYAGEIEEKDGERNEDYRSRRARCQVEAYEKRLDNVIRARNELSSSMVDARVLWGGTAIPEIESVLAVADRLIFVAFPTWKEQELAQLNLRDMELWKETRRVLFTLLGDDDAFGKELDEMIKKAETALRKHSGIKVKKY